MRDTHNTLRRIHVPSSTAPPFSERGDIGDGTQERIVNPELIAHLIKRHGILLCGLSDARDNFCFVRHHPWFWHVLVTVGGAGEIWNAERQEWERCETNDAYVAPPDIPHAYRLAPGGESWQIAWVHLVAGALPVRAAYPTRIVADGNALAVSIRGLHTELVTAGTADPLISESWVALVRAYATRLCTMAASVQSGVPLGDPRLVRLYNEVAADPAHPWTLEELAERARVSTEHLRRLCRTEGLESPLRRVTELRMRHAAALLSSGFYTVERAALRVGYTNAFAFSTA
ncbi:MAG: AraC family transcriptional regulator, partial [Alphaproteobacteria bacterium]